MTSERQQMTLMELAEVVQLPGRTIRFYIARGLLPGPLKAGRGAMYGKEHRDALERIVQLQREGLTLTEIARRLAGGPAEALPSAPSAWWHYPVADDVTVAVRADASPWRLKQIQHALASLQAALRQTQE